MALDLVHAAPRSMAPMALIALLTLTLAACSGTPAVSNESAGEGGAAVSTLRSFVQALEERGVEVETEGEVDQPFFSPPGIMLSVAGEDVQVFEYDTEAARQEASEAISADGTAIGTSQVHWIGTPRFWAGGRILVLYLGGDETVVEHLSAVLGSPIAGRDGRADS